MPIRPNHLFIGLFLLLAGCSQLQQTGQAISDSNGVLQDGETRYLGKKKYQLRVAGSSMLFYGQAEQFFLRRAESLSQKMGCRGWKLLEYKSGTENTLIGARQYADGVIQCL
ncbi:hypothetical protein FNU76_10425 [Chitinimonas arctica]|uniref:DUF4156 domain-containing protein n=1 Tax=Chitinimonas arctica TaxID=2594795 RepID=A0A516SF07_9NEIS|nr:hypothetical protein [Chitinimonas arctica]QDQ26745.1 hypothetical protein FNU76_10425 [Chitinimonas arctica]